MAGDHERAEGRDDVAAIEPAPSAGCQQHDAGHRQGDAGHVDPPDPVAPDELGDHRDEEDEEVVEDAGPRDAGPLDAEDEAQVGQPEGDSDRHAAEEGGGIEFSQASGADSQHDSGRQDEPGEHKQLRRDRGDTDFGEQKTAPPEEGGQHQEKIDPVHGGGCCGVVIEDGCSPAAVNVFVVMIFGDNRQVGGGPVQFRHPVRRYPLQRVMLIRGDDAACQAAGERVEGDGEVGVAVGCRGECRADTDADAEFLHQLAAQALLRRFAGFDLAAGELPFERQGHGCAALRRQHGPLLFDDGAGHVQMALHGAVICCCFSICAPTQRQANW